MFKQRSVALLYGVILCASGAANAQHTYAGESQASSDEDPNVAFAWQLKDTLNPAPEYVEEEEKNVCESFKPSDEDWKVGETVFPTGTKIAWEHDWPSTCLRSTTDVVFDDVAYKKGTDLIIHQDGDIVMGTIAHPETVRDFTFPAGSELIYQQNPATKNVKKVLGMRGPSDVEAVILGSSMRIGQNRFPAGTVLWFKPGTELDRAELPQTTMLHGIPFCAGSVQMQVSMRLLFGGSFRGKDIIEQDCELELYPDGNIRSGVLAQNAFVQGVSLPIGTTLTLNEQGTVKRAFFQGQIAYYNGAQLANLPTGSWSFVIPGHDLIFHENGRIAQAELLHPATFNGVRYAGLGPIAFHPNGRVAEGTLGATAFIQGRRLAVLTDVTFDEAGRLTSGCDLVCNADKKCSPECWEMKEASP